MPSRKVLRSVAHNVGHAFLSLMNHRSGDPVVEWLFRTAKAHGLKEVQIDLMSGRIEPAVFRISPVLDAVENYSADLSRHVVASGSAMEHVRSCVMDLRFDLDEEIWSSAVPNLQLAVYECVMSIEDDRGVTHSKEVIEWWKY